MVQILVMVLKQGLPEIRRNTIMKYKKKNIQIKKRREKRGQMILLQSQLNFILEDIRHFDLLPNQDRKV